MEENATIWQQHCHDERIGWAVALLWLIITWPCFGENTTIYEDVSTLYWWKKMEPKNTDQILLQKDFGLGDRTTEEFSFSDLRSYNVLGVKYSNLLGIVPIAVLSFVRRYFTIVIFSPSRLIWNHLVLVPHLDHSDGRGHLDILPDNGGKYREHGTKDKFTQRRWE